jgi:chromosome segregation ATPase
MRKLFLSARAYDAASSKSKASLSTMTSSQSSIQSDIESLTVVLNHEKKIRKNREEYNTLAKMINTSHPPAKKTRADLESVREEISRTQEEVERAQWEIGIRERQVRLFMTSLGDLREVLRDEDWRKSRGEALPGAVAPSDESAEHDAETTDRMDTDDAGAL